MKTRVLVIDDHKDIVDSFSDYLKIKGIDVIGCGYNGKQAVEMYSNLKPDVVLMDIMMPEYDGFYGLEQIRKTDPGAKVIMATGGMTSDIEKRLNELGHASIILKPYNIENVIETK